MFLPASIPIRCLIPDFLTATLGQFRDPEVAYVQSPQDYYNADSSLIARGCDEESRDFYWITQRAYHRFGSPSLIGAHHLHRMAALEKLGGLGATCCGRFASDAALQVVRLAGSICTSRSGARSCAGRLGNIHQTTAKMGEILAGC